MCVCVRAYIADELGSLRGLLDVWAVGHRGVVQVVLGVAPVGNLQGFGREGRDYRSAISGHRWGEKIPIRQFFLHDTIVSIPLY